MLKNEESLIKLVDGNVSLYKPEDLFTLADNSISTSVQGIWLTIEEARLIWDDLACMASTLEDYGEHELATDSWESVDLIMKRIEESEKELEKMDEVE